MRAPQRGFTLIEAVVALAILTAGLTAALQLTGSGLRAAERSRLAAERSAEAALLLSWYDVVRTPMNGTLKDGIPYRVDVFEASYGEDGAVLPTGLLRVEVYFGDAPGPALVSYRAGQTGG
ncbi:PulJ/GspJ family protein [Parvularcula maris]|uniref:Type II secretion system GspH family protein n=1 Tax=Parvularcula maris TaxID=2965077 RepID=A0A9X2RLF9_9PROT|nr:type II secretion system protein [Parvularcula maris]MCQ8186497.1 type II secretion system GspH family protein [Parvularcula maris]